MGNSAGASQQIIAAPKGGGAQKGIGEKFSPDLFTGTGNFTVPIALPPGRNGFQPQLNLVYSTGHGNGPFGLGWNLSVPGVSRKTWKGIPRYEDARDVFILSGAEDLVPVERSGAVTRYRPRTEGLFASIERYDNAHGGYWQVKSKDGLISIYGTPPPQETGNPAPQETGHPWRDPATVADPDDPTKIFAWHLTQTTDPFGNRIVYDYERDQGHDGPHQWDKVYLKTIRYADYGDSSNPQFLVSATFEYEDRPDPFSDYRAGFEIRTRRRYQEILIHTHADQTRLVRSYLIDYLDEQIAAGELRPELAPLNGVSLLGRVRVIGHDDDQPVVADRLQPLPPLTFEYSRFQPDIRRFSAIQGADLPATSLANRNLELVDLFGRGLPDILEMNGAVRYWRNLGSGRFDLPRPMRDAPAGVALADAGVQLVDADGDGRTDLLVTTPQFSGYYPLRFGAELGPQHPSLPAGAELQPGRPRGQAVRSQWRRRHRRHPLGDTAGMFFQRSQPGLARDPLGRTAGTGGVSQRQFLRSARSFRGHVRRPAPGHRADSRRQRRLLAEPRPRRLGPAGAHGQQPAFPLRLQPRSHPRRRRRWRRAGRYRLRRQRADHPVDQPERQPLERADRHPRHAPRLGHGCGAPHRPAR